MIAIAAAATVIAAATGETATGETGIAMLDAMDRGIRAETAGRAATSRVRITAPGNQSAA